MLCSQWCLLWPAIGVWQGQSDFKTYERSPSNIAFEITLNKSKDEGYQILTLMLANHDSARWGHLYERRKCVERRKCWRMILNFDITHTRISRCSPANTTYSAWNFWARTRPVSGSCLATSTCDRTKLCTKLPTPTPTECSTSCSSRSARKDFSTIDVLDQYAFARATAGRFRTTRNVQ